MCITWFIAAVLDAGAYGQGLTDYCSQEEWPCRHRSCGRSSQPE